MTTDQNIIELYRALEAEVRNLVPGTPDEDDLRACMEQTAQELGVTVDDVRAVVVRDIARAG